MASSGLNIVWGEVNVITLIAFLVQLTTIIVFLVRASDRAIMALDKARRALDQNAEQDEAIARLESMQREIKEAHECAKSCKDQITILNSTFALYRETVAREYINRESLKDSEAKIERSITAMGHHLEWVIQNRGPVGGKDG